MAGTFDQFVRFGTDIVGLERILRGIQSLLQIVTFYPVLLLYIAQARPALSPLTLGPALLVLSSKVGAVRRTLRTFRFLDSFSSGLSVYQRGGEGIDAWLAVINKTTLGMYGLLETVTLLDILDIPGLSFFDQAQCKSLNDQAQMFWFVALLASVLSSSRKLLGASGKPLTADTNKSQGRDEVSAEGVKNSSQEAKPEDIVKTSSKSVKDLHQQKTAQLKTSTSRETQSVFVQAVSDSLDMLLPASAVGWIDMDKGKVAIAMLITTLITGRNVWKRCG